MPLARRIGDNPYVDLWVEGTRLRDDLHRHVRSVSVDLDVDKADELSIQVAELVEGQSTADVLDSRAWGEGNRVVVWTSGGAGQPALCLGRFELQLAIPSGDSSGRSLEVVGLSASHRLLTHTDPYAAPAKMLDHDVVREIARAYGWSLQIDEGTLTRAQGRTKKAGTSDFAFLNEIARTARNREGAEYRWFVRYDPISDQDVFHFEPFRVDPLQRRYTFRYEASEDGSGLSWASTLRSYHVNPALKGLPTKMSLVYLDLSSGKEQEIVVELSDAATEPSVLFVGAPGKTPIRDEVSDGAAVQLTAFGPQDHRTGGLAFNSGEDAAAYALRKFRQHQFAFATLTGSTVGVETVRPWDVHDFKGMHPRWDGQYLITQVKHVHSGNGDLAYALDFTANKLPTAESAPRLR